MHQRTSSLRFLLGAFLAAAGTLLMISRLGWLNFKVDIDLWQLWPLVFFAIGISSLSRRDWTGSVVFFSLGAVFLAPQIFPEVEIQDLFELWPVVLVFVGASLVLRSLGPRKKKPRPSSESGRNAIFRNRDVCEESDAYAGDDLIAIIATCRVDLRKARLAPEGAVVEVFAFWGGIELLVPEHMPVDLRVFPLMGGAEDRSKPPPAVPPGAPRLIVRGFVWMGGLEIKN